MRQMRRSIVVTLLGVAILSLGTTPCWAGHAFKKLSSEHVSFGVSQFLAGSIPPASDHIALKLLNPNHVTQVAAVFVYDRTKRREFDDAKGTAGLFRGCLLQVLVPHAALGLGPTSGFPENPSNTPTYVEVISAPETPVLEATGNRFLELWRKKKGIKPKTLRMADGLGIVAHGASLENIPLFRLHPGMFSLPSEDVPENKPGAATNCVCDGLSKLELDPEVFEDFGIDCP